MIFSIWLTLLFVSLWLATPTQNSRGFSDIIAIYYARKANHQVDSLNGSGKDELLPKLTKANEATYKSNFLVDFSDNGYVAGRLPLKESPANTLAFDAAAHTTGQDSTELRRLLHLMDEASPNNQALTEFKQSNFGTDEKYWFGIENRNVPGPQGRAPVWRMESGLTSNNMQLDQTFEKIALRTGSGTGQTASTSQMETWYEIAHKARGAHLDEISEGYALMADLSDIAKNAENAKKGSGSLAVRNAIDNYTPHQQSVLRARGIPDLPAGTAPGKENFALSKKIKAHQTLIRSHLAQRNAVLNVILPDVQRLTGTQFATGDWAHTNKLPCP